MGPYPDVAKRSTTSDTNMGSPMSSARSTGVAFSGAGPGERQGVTTNVRWPVRSAAMRIALHVPRPDFLQPGFSGDHFILPAIRSGLTARGHEVEVVSSLDAREA